MLKEVLKVSVATIILSATVVLRAGESLPSKVVGFVKYDLTVVNGNGLNFVAIPLSQAENVNGIGSMFDVAAQIGPNLAQALKFNNATKTYANYLAPWTSGFNISQGDNFIVIVSANSEFVVAGGVNESTSPISFNLSHNGYDGLNAVSAVPYSDTHNYSSIFDAEQAVGVNFAQGIYHNNSTKFYTNFISGDPQGSNSDFSIEAGTPFYIIVSGNTTFSGPTSSSNPNQIFSAQKVSSKVKTTSGKKAPIFKRTLSKKNKAIRTKSQKKVLKK